MNTPYYYGSVGILRHSRPRPRLWQRGLTAAFQWVTKAKRRRTAGRQLAASELRQQLAGRQDRVSIGRACDTPPWRA